MGKQLNIKIRQIRILLILCLATIVLNIIYNSFDILRGKLEYIKIILMGVLIILYGLLTGIMIKNFIWIKWIGNPLKIKINDCLFSHINAELIRIIQEQKQLIKDIQDKLINDRVINKGITCYFDSLYQELITMSEEKNIELNRQQLIDNIMDEIYDNIHIALDRIVKEKSNELAKTQEEIEKYNCYVDEIINEKTRKLFKENKDLKKIAMTDELTGLSNRRGFFLMGINKIKEAFKKKTMIVLLYIDVDNLKGINDDFGHDEGDFLLKEVAWVLCRSLRKDDIVSRLGGDEFVLLVETKNISSVIKRIEYNINWFNKHSGKDYSMSLSMGYESLIPDKRTHLTNMLQAADAKMYAQKRKKVLR